jgi:hypothetical protein
MNVELLENVRQAIVFYPRRFSAAQWAFARNAEAVIDDGDHPEGFKCCIAGHVLLESDEMTERELLQVGGFHTGGGLWEQCRRSKHYPGAVQRTVFSEPVGQTVQTELLPLLQ